MSEIIHVPMPTITADWVTNWSDIFEKNPESRESIFLDFRKATLPLALHSIEKAREAGVKFMMGIGNLEGLGIQMIPDLTVPESPALLADKPKVLEFDLSPTLEFEEFFSSNKEDSDQNQLELSFDRPSIPENFLEEVSPEAGSSKEETPVMQGRAPTLNWDERVRSGQQIIAENCDLVVTSCVSQGAELISDGSVHIYGAMTGRVFAGHNGDKNARVFCLCFRADLVSIAGCYQVFEEIPEDLIDKPVMFWLENDQLMLKVLGE